MKNTLCLILAAVGGYCLALSLTEFRGAQQARDLLHAAENLETRLYRDASSARSRGDSTTADAIEYAVGRFEFLRTQSALSQQTQP